MKSLRKEYLFLILAALLLIGAKPIRLARYQVINKAEMDIAIKLEGQNLDQIYYLPVSRGSADTPTVKTFTLVRDTYNLTVHYLELWDPVYGTQCNAGSDTLDMTRNQRMTFLDCDRQAPNRGEPGMTKFGGARGRAGRPR